MAFNPLEEKGRKMEDQFRSWDKLNVKPYNKDEVDPYTKCRIILMNGIEVEASMFLHQFARHTSDMELKRKLAAGRRIEQQQQKVINWFSPGNETALETTIGFEQVAVDLTAWLARNEPDPHMKAALDFALLEDFDHLYRYANLLEMRKGIKAEQLVGEYTEIFPGRPTTDEHRHPFDSPRDYVDFKQADILTKLHSQIIVAGEQQTMNFYMNIGNTEEDEVARGLYQEIAMIEEQHVSHYESLMDPRISWYERLLLHEYTECYMYYSCLQYETENRVKSYWESCLEDEIGHLHMAADLFKEKENRDPAEIIPDDFPELVKFQPNKEYVREILQNQLTLTGDGANYTQTSELPDDHRYFDFQNKVNQDGVPSQQVIRERIQKEGQDYRFESEAEHPVKKFRDRDKVESIVGKY